MESNLIMWIQNWYHSQCDGDWEHECGLKIISIDNPGWDITVDIVKIDFSKEIDWRYFETSENDWFGYKIEDSYFSASGDPTKLEFLLQLFKNFVENGEKVLPL